MTNSIQHYAMIAICIDGRLQAQESSFAFFNGIEDGKVVTRLTVTWAFPEEGLEFDPREHIGTEHPHHVSAIASNGDTMFQMKAKIVGWRLDRKADHEAIATCVFEPIDDEKGAG